MLMAIRQGKNAENEVWGSSVYVIKLFLCSNASHWTLCPGVDALPLPQIIVIHGSVDSCAGPARGMKIILELKSR
jgi:hypothetical protein